MTHIDPVGALRAMLMIRTFEDTLARRKEHGFQLLSSGEEAVAVGLASALGAGDQLLTGGRSIGPALARGVAPERVMAELLGKSGGMNQGRAGRGHMSDPEVGFFGAHAVVGGNISIAAGVAMARQLDGDGGIVVILFGDGACGAGALHETMNMAAQWKLPILFVCNNNQLSVSTTRDAALAVANLSDLGATFGMWTRTIDGLDVQGVAAAARDAVRYVRDGLGPAFLECKSIRLRSHSTTARETRSRAELAELQTHCPIRRHADALQADGMLDDAQLEQMRQDAATEIAQAMAYAEASPYPAAQEVLRHVV
ncbi:thiamine pyrophosphate-dependent dehydrogenase E1 component subunit alpha [Gluconacetobacter azotocaptans]|uniref:Thiamine pyrophosphate-dependent dehydrogenase E1 component subunit alpha n=1 Tax=Gluconacetobacter azotocaptans TaxID=142834 RepID=A0A7W4JPM4_9PROT|nr:thiamine pyrophosphate-dependent dehydrogenase E1 component subunit alpha [Gluconacetobacter azotocaptans]MBB2188586.1 thiamine pyrophosphate-dependent dehydrogenase E1 component subunit alpha [Gluconacetobacter azotocaptans]GBQ35465.1 pyruvate dehydrogenase E1 component subunit alpha [Gluconacetobacter azotocaptans DSM 13594]